MAAGRLVYLSVFPEKENKFVILPDESAKQFLSEIN